MKYFQRFRHCAWALFVPGIFTLVYACDKGKRNLAPVALSPLDSTHKLAGTWMMHGIIDTDQIDVYDSSFAIRDTALTLTVINDSTIAIGNTLFNYTSQSSNDSMLYYWHVYHQTLYEDASISFYFLKDSVVYDHLVLAIPDGFVETRYYTYK